jgi:hypothetical protein
MKNFGLVLAAAGVVALWGGHCFAEPRSGAALHLLGGAGYASGNYAFEGNSHPGSGVPVQPLTLESTVVGPGLTAALQPGWWLTPQIELALELGGNVQLGGSNGGLSETRINGTLGWQALALVDVHVSERPGLHVQAGGGFAKTKFLWEQNDIGSWDNIVKPSSVQGGTGVVGVGYDVSESFGLVLRASYARLSNDDSRYRPMTVGLTTDVTLL